MSEKRIMTIDDQLIEATDTLSRVRAKIAELRHYYSHATLVDAKVRHILAEIERAMEGE